jgi:hypothetical protein
MENLFVYLPEYAIALLIEVVLFGCLAYFLSTQKKVEVSRRWIASSFSAALFGFLIHFAFMLIIIIAWVSKLHMGTYIRTFKKRSWNSSPRPLELQQSSACL